MARNTILVVDDEEPIRLSLASIVRGLDFDVLIAADGEEASAALSTTNIDIVITDLIMPRMDGYGLMRWMQLRNMSQPILVISGYGSPESIAEALRLGAYDYIFKPFNRDDVDAALRRAETSVEHRRVEATLRRRNRELDALSTISTAVSSSLDLDEMLDHAMGAMVDALDLTGTIIYLSDQKGELVLYRDYGPLHSLPHQVPTTIALPIDRGIAIGEVQVAQMLQIGEQIAWHPNESLKAAIPLLAHGELHGLLLLVGSQVHMLQHDHLALLEAIGNYVGVAMANVQHYSEVRDTALLLERLVAQRTQELQQSRDLLGIIFDGIPGGLLLADAQERVLTTNRAYAQMVDQQPGALINHSYSQIWATPGAGNTGHLLRRCVATGRAIYQRDRLERPESSPRMLDHYLFPVFDTAGQVIQVIEYLEDVTERLALESVMTQTEQLVALGKLAATVAHHVNTPLLAIRGCLGLIASAKTNEAARNEYLALAESELDRAATIIRNMLDFYQSAGSERTLTDVNYLTEKVVQLLKAECTRRHVQINLQLTPGIPLIPATPDHIKQLIFNMVINAMEVLIDGGCITLRTSLQTINIEAMAELVPGSFVAVVPSRSPRQSLNNGAEYHDQFVVIEVEDTGNGVPEILQARIFDAFFTTKTGSNGLGLAVCRTIVRDHRGFINVQNVPGSGACFTVGFPVQDEQVPYAELRRAYGA